MVIIYAFILLAIIIRKKENKVELIKSKVELKESDFEEIEQKAIIFKL